MKIISMNKGSYAFILGLLLWCFHMQANYLRWDILALGIQSSVSGTVTDATGPLPGVYITVKGTSTSTSTDAEGKFTIPASKGDILVFAYIGFKTIEVTVKDEAPIKVQLSEDATTLKELEINAGYYKVKDKERTGSIARITSKDIENQPVTNVLATMQGRMAGVNVTQSTGMPGGGFDIEIRGRNSLRADGNSPLYIVDGVPYTSESTGSGYTTTMFPTGSNPLNSISPEAIESIEVLKDADATAIYGSRGANGVVLITTKKGKQGKTNFSFTSSTAFGTVTKFMNLMNSEQYLRMRRQAFINDGITEYPTNAYDVNGTWDQIRSTDWQKELIGKTARIQNMQGTISGGSEQTRFLFGGNYQSQTTVFPGNFDYKKGGANLSLSHDSKDGLFSLILSTMYTVQNNTLPASDLTIYSRTLAPNAPALYQPDGSLNWENNTWVNPLAELAAIYNAKTTDLVTNAVLAYRPVRGLEIKGSLGYTSTRNDETRTSPSTIYNPSFGLGPEYSALFINTVDRHSWIIEPQVNYSVTIGDGTLNALVGTSFQERTSEQLTQFGSGFTSNNLIHNLSAATQQQVAIDQNTKYRYAAFFCRINYEFKQRYIVNLTGRRDGSSRFGPGNQFATFGAIGTAWIFSREHLLDNTTVLSFGKVRASYGTTGSDQIGDYQFLDTYTNSGLAYQGIIGLSPSRLYNPNFSWEENKKLEVALELGFLKDRIYFTGAWYRNRSSNQLVGVPMPGTTGFPTLQANLGATVENAGLEFSIATDNISTENFSWTTNFNISLPKNRLISFPGLENSSYQNKYRIGQPVNIQLVYEYTGIDPLTGTYQFADLNKDGSITAPEDMQKSVSLDPKFFGGLQNQLKYKNWNLDFLFQFTRQKRPSFTMGNAGTMVNQPAALKDSWMQPGDNSTYQIYTTGLNEDAVQSQYRYDSSDRSIVDGSFIRLKNIALSYDLSIQESLKCRLFLKGQNLITITKYKDGDPEFALLGYLPPLKVISAGVQLNF